MQAVISGNVGKNVEVKNILLPDGSGFFELAEISLSVKTNPDFDDCFKLRFTDKLIQIAQQYILKGMLLSVVGQLEFEYWIERETQEHKSCPVIIVSEIQLPPRFA
jgi:single-stranded DNA-binding protein